MAATIGSTMGSGMISRYAVPGRKTLYLEIKCAICGYLFEVSDRRDRAMRAEGTTPRCPDCRHPRPRPAPDEEGYAFWTSRFSMAEIRVFAAALFGPWE